MNIGINGINTYSRNANYAQTSFKGLRTYKNIGFALGAAALLSFASCKKTSPSDIVEISTKVENNDKVNSTIQEYTYRDNKVRKEYHYHPKDNNSEYESSNYDWVETIYPDGRIEKDSLGHKIYISPKGERTVIKTEQDQSGNTIITTTLPNGEKSVRKEYSMTANSGETLNVTHTYRSNGKLKDVKYFNEYPSDSANVNSKKIVEKEEVYFNENEVLVKWESTKIDPERNEKNNKYDTKKRLIYDDVKNEKYQYKGNSKTPFRSISQYDDCKRITLYDKEGNVEKVFFKASDGTITE